MNILTKIKFWSFLIIGIVCIFIGAYLFPFGPDKRNLAEMFLLVGAAQLILFAFVFILRHRKKKKEIVSS